MTAPGFFYYNSKILSILKDFVDLFDGHYY